MQLLKEYNYKEHTIRNCQGQADLKIKRKLQIQSFYLIQHCRYLLESHWIVPFKMTNFMFWIQTPKGHLKVKNVVVEMGTQWIGLTAISLDLKKK